MYKCVGTFLCCSVTKLCLILCDPMNWSMPGFPVYIYTHTHTYVHTYILNAYICIYTYIHECKATAFWDLGLVYYLFQVIMPCNLWMEVQISRDKKRGWGSPRRRAKRLDLRRSELSKLAFSQKHCLVPAAREPGKQKRLRFTWRFTLSTNNSQMYNRKLPHKHQSPPPQSWLPTA